MQLSDPKFRAFLLDLSSGHLDMYKIASVRRGGVGVGNKAIDMVLITYTVQERMYGAGVLDRSNYLQTRPKRGQSTDRPMHEIDLRDAEPIS